MRFTCLLIFFFARLAAGQTLPPRTSVTVHMLNLPTVEGRLVASDSATITVARGDSQIVIPRDRIERILASQPTTRQFAVPTAIGGGIAGALLGALVVGGLCDSGSCDDDYPKAMLGMGGLGAVAGAIAGTVVGGLIHTDQRVPNSVRVAGWPAGPNAREICGLPTVQGTTGTMSYRLSATLYCAPRFSLGAELGRVSNGSAGSYQSAAFNRNPAPTDTTFSVSRLDTHRMDFRGAFAELSVGGVLNPRILTSLGYYRQQLTTNVDTFFFVGTSTSPRRNGMATTRGGIGGGLGLAVSLPLWQHISLGAEERTHFTAIGTPRVQSTFGVTLRIRP